MKLSISILCPLILVNALRNEIGYAFSVANRRHCYHLMINNHHHGKKMSNKESIMQVSQFHHPCNYPSSLCLSNNNAKNENLESTIPNMSNDNNNNDADDDDDWGAAPATAFKETERQQQDIKNNTNGKERDLFIPIFSIVSLLGLFGAYGYEMLRLNSLGELYLPWNT